MILQAISWGLFIIALIGAVLNVKKLASCFVFWSFSNLGWAVYNYKIGEVVQAGQYLMFFILALYGIWIWWGKSAVKEILNKSKTTGVGKGWTPVCSIFNQIYIAVERKKHNR